MSNHLLGQLQVSLEQCLTWGLELGGSGTWDEVDMDSRPRAAWYIRGESVPVPPTLRLRSSNVNTCGFLCGDTGECGVMLSVSGEVSLPDAEPTRRRLMRWYSLPERGRSVVISWLVVRDDVDICDAFASDSVGEFRGSPRRRVAGCFWLARSDNRQKPDVCDGTETLPEQDEKHRSVAPLKTELQLYTTFESLW